MYSLTEIQEHLEAATQSTISRQMIGYWFSPDKDKLPTDRYLPHLAKFFGVPTAYFYDDEVAREIDDEIKNVLALRALTDNLDEDDTQVLLRSLGDGFTPEQAKQVVNLVRQLKAESVVMKEDTDAGVRRGAAVPLPDFRPPRRNS
ncbi:hypothetical protein ACFORH_39200 [Amycolatopsis roodepoortensis]|uniref:Transcriptional regulator with XRE-family HTH domain n=1 Tax=Amycolatopsis roodepoortensis TaxID=700274 RepID=A0ABR9LJ92_9PSEU|nr:hypothetical protein [Amycolatopsis roodepoortensis]MBE1580545.1 transcriptional regulator with XRE-family HTH domain [Amycolatopsis roodepoortensis]